MAADEQEPQDVVAIVPVVDGLDHRHLAVLEVGHRRVVVEWPLPPLPPRGVDGGILADEDEPRRRVARRPLLGPRLERPEAGLLHRLLGRVEIAEMAQQGGHRLWPGGGQHRVDPAEIAHAAPLPRSK